LGAVYGRLFSVFNSVNDVPTGWRVLGESSSTDFIKFTVALQNQNMKLLREELYDISNPSSENYGKWWSKDKIADFIAPPVAYQAKWRDG